MLVTAGEVRDSSPVDVNIDTKAGSQLDISLQPASGRSGSKPNVADSIAQELSHWEKVVFKFDMDREQGGSSRGNERDDGSKSGRPGQSGSGSTPPSNTNIPSHPFSNAANAPSMGFPSYQQNIPDSAHLRHLGQVGGGMGLGGLDPYTLAQLAALSALSGPGPSQGSHSNPMQPNPNDPFAMLRMMQGLMHPGASPGEGGPSSVFPPSPGVFPPQHHHQNTGHPQAMQDPNAQNFLSTPAGLQWIAQMQGGFGHPLAAMQPSPVPSHGQGHRQGQGSRQGQPQLAPLIFPGSFPSSQSAGAGPSNVQNATAGSSRGRGSQAHSPSPGSPSIPTTPGGTEMDEAAIQEDKRRRNTAASARFRIKKKHKTLALERSVVELEGRADDLEREAAELRRENGWLKEMLIMKGRRARAAVAAAEAQLNEEEDDDDDDDESEEEAEEAESLSNQKSNTGKGKGKQREK